MISALPDRLDQLLAEDVRHLSVLTGLRGFAALWVYVYHVWGLSGHPEFAVALGGYNLNFTPLVSLGGAGVTLFFVLSGFLLGLPFAQWQAGMRARPRLGRYFFRRVMRVFPAYYVQLIILLVIAVAVSGRSAIPDLPALLRHLAMLFVPPPLGTAPLNGVWWTLPIEFSFYLLLPFFSFLLHPQRWWWLLAGSLLSMWLWRHSVIVQLADAPIPMRVISAYQLAGSFDMFGLGMLAGMMHVHRARLPHWVSAVIRHEALAILGLGLLIVAVYWLAANRQYYWANHPIFYLWTPLLSLGTIMLILAGTGGSRLAAILFSNRLMVFVGIISYSIYLWHLPLLDGVVAAINYSKLLPGNHFTGLLLLSLPAILVISVLSYVLVERPFMHKQ